MINVLGFVILGNFDDQMAARPMLRTVIDIDDECAWPCDYDDQMAARPMLHTVIDVDDECAGPCNSG